MRIECPFCGERDVSEFSYLGDADFRLPSADTDGLADRFYEAVYLRDNPSGPHRELWYHAGGCLCWLRVTRNTRTHEILGVELATEAPRA
ncbi:MAG: sarcosine oxidase subunit delta [Steroidobacterales bacterium]|jgi:sarcosine oxidase subunit delta